MTEVYKNQEEGFKAELQLANLQTEVCGCAATSFFLLRLLLHGWGPLTVLTEHDHIDAEQSLT